MKIRESEKPIPKTKASKNNKPKLWVTEKKPNKSRETGSGFKITISKLSKSTRSKLKPRLMDFIRLIISEFQV
jgi:hypothetical protein